MNVAILCEAPADESAICILVGALLRTDIERIPRRARAGGWNAALTAVPPTLKELHYQRTATALVVVIDSDNSTVHRPEHEQSGSEDSECRLCELREQIKDVERH